MGSGGTVAAGGVAGGVGWLAAEVGAPGRLACGAGKRILSNPADGAFDAVPLAVAVFCREWVVISVFFAKERVFFITTKSCFRVVLFFFIGV
ncbi:hypothetical protein NM75_15025 [Dickeya fangzhongdai]|nr:hypothetical protein NM75_15025 [Dickeya fangzhongdai]